MRTDTKKMVKPIYVTCLIVTILFLLSANGAHAVRQYSMGSAGSQGAWYMVNSIVAKIISENVPDVRLTAVVSPGASTENARRIHAREMEFALSTGASSFLAFHGLDVFTPIKHDILAWYTGQQMAYVLIVRADSNIKSIADLKGKVIALDKKGTAGYVQSLRILQAHGLEPGDFKEATQSRGDAAGGFIDGRIDCWFFSTTTATPHITKMIAARDVRFLSVDKAKMKLFMEEYPYYALKDYEDFRGLKQSFTWVHFYECAIVGSYLDEELVYQCTKALFENIDQLHAASPVYKEYNLEDALSGVKIPLHPGALRYYKEKNVKGWDNPKFQYKPGSR